MLRIAASLIICTAGCLVIGCANNDRDEGVQSRPTTTQSADDANASPEDKTRAQQIDRMRAEDDAKHSRSRKSEPQPAPTERREERQKVIDQPIRR
jgi:hypothetical protein